MSQGSDRVEITWEMNKKYTEIDNCQVPYNKEEIVCVSIFLELAVYLLCREARKRYNYGGKYVIYENQAQKRFSKIEYYCLSSLIKKKKKNLSPPKLEYLNKAIKWGDKRQRMSKLYFLKI